MKEVSQPFRNKRKVNDKNIMYDMEVSIPILVLDDGQMPASPDEVVLAALMVLKRRLK
jgi:hypothetical protein